MKKFNKKSFALLIAVALLLTFTVSSTVAYLAASTDPVENKFTPASVDTEITEEVESGTKSVIKVTNAANSIDVYVRVAVIGTWVKDDQIVGSWTPADGQFNTTDWFADDNGYYYYKYVVAPNGETSDLLATNITSTTEDGAHLEVTVIHQSIQATPKTAVAEAWGADIASKLEDTTKSTTE